MIAFSRIKFFQRSLFKKIILVLSAEYINLGVLFVINILISRNYGITEMGFFNMSYAFSQVFIVGIGGAFSPIIRRDITNNPQSALFYINKVLAIRCVIIALIAIFCVIISHFFFTQTTSILLLLLLLAKGTDSLNETFFTTFQSTQKISVYALIKSSNAFLSLLLTVLVIFYEKKIEFVYYAMLSASFFTLLINNYLKHKFFKINSYEIQQGSLTRYLILETWPIALNNLVFQLSSRINIFTIGYFLDDESVGVFSSALMAITVFTAVSNGIGISLFEKINKLYQKNKDLFFYALLKILSYYFIIGIIISFLYVSTIPMQIMLVGKLPAYTKLVFIIMGLGIPFIFVTGIIGNVFTIMGRQKYGMYLSLVLFIFNTLLFVILITYFSHIGMAFSFVSASILQLGIILWGVYYFTKKIC